MRQALLAGLLTGTGLLWGCASSTSEEINSAGRKLQVALAPGAGEESFLRVDGVGHQIYECAVRDDAGEAPAWRLSLPDALLEDAGGRIVGRHGAGPTWTWPDGSGVIGRVSRSQPAPRAEAIPWLLINAQPYQNRGVLAQTTSIQRLETQGGVAPAAGCDGAHIGRRATVPYRARYVFWRAVDDTDGRTPRETRR